VTSPQVWPVIHLSTPELAYRNADIAVRCGAAGVFLIEMGGLDDAIDPVAVELKRRYPNLKVGINYLSLPAPIALVRTIGLGMDATWADRPGVRSNCIEDSVEAITPVLRTNPGHLFFASVAFKYQPVDPNPALAALRAHELGMIPTTSGTATGVAPSSQKLYGMRKVLGDKPPLAVASGITQDNAYELGRFLSHILVSTGISESFYSFSEPLLARLMEQVADL
jgi:hypothetical protein